LSEDAAGWDEAYEVHGTEGDEGWLNAEKAYDLAEKTYVDMGVDVKQAMRKLADTSISLQCWQETTWRASRTPVSPSRAG
jgi:hypothetical protein